MAGRWQGCLMAAAVAALAAGGEAPVPQIPDVSTLEQLQRIDPVRVPGGWEVRLGLAEPGADAGPWKLLYCQAHYVGEGAEPSLPTTGTAHGEFLGPVFYALGKSEVLGKWAMQHRKLPADCLFCGVVLTAWKGAYDLRVLSYEGKLLARRAIAVGEPKPCTWQEFAQLRRHLAEGEPAFFVRRDATAARPGYPELSPIWPPVGMSVKLAEEEAGGTPLPGRIAWRGGLFPLKLSLEGNLFVVRGEFTRMLLWPDFHLLARWWVNDKPVVPPRADQIRMIQIGRAVTYGKEMSVAFGWPDNLGKLQAGDRVGLQVLYSPAMIEQLAKERDGAMMMKAMAPDEPGVAQVPLLSNRIDFALTQALLEAREKNLKAGEAE